ncbi:hypothetical protein ALQ76_02014, partial [Pseudomonas syringae pv. atrofaciens]
SRRRFGVQNTAFANKFAPTKAPHAQAHGRNVGANLFAKGPVQPQKIRRSKHRLREQVRSYKSTPCSSVWQKCRSERVR